MPPPSLARQFFERLVGAIGRPDADRAATIRSLVNADPPTYETDWLDFKREETANPQHRDKKYREQLSEAMSGFGNAGGGVLVWGVVATKADLNGVPTDHAHSEEPVENPVAVAEKLRAWAGQATDPPLGGYEVVAVPLPDRPGRGFVVLYVPDGPLKPYRAEMVAGKPFHLRAGDSTPVMPYRALAAMFYPKASPVFWATATLKRNGPGDGTAFGHPSYTSLTCDVRLGNHGPASGRDVEVLATIDLPGKLGQLEGGVQARLITGSGNIRVVQLNSPLHPSHSALLFRIESGFLTTEIHLWKIQGCPTARIALAVHSHDREPQHLALDFDLDTLLAQLRLEVDFKPVEA